ncbi:hypothetical protein FA10DRAFT_268942 [Acaromyces ingoldii]|uniref:HNH nuclease domain-containing protein n=1 Tax=Acaromyces ingoldii TaxID=215250 RepID=A0A316YL66_9BASI|nr:hypothetical protein FA10DRAFT_268942 [Acaromyces ingoldii]PWN88803.1 hypothetical protein FA10DRAFT_268942 [Acaromyces ingoldii]
MAAPPSPSRNVFVFSREEEIAGFWQHGNVSKGRFREWLEYCWRFEQGGSPVAWSLAERCDPANLQVRRVICPSADKEMAKEAMPPGTFDVLSDGTWQPVDHVSTSHVYHRRTISLNSSSPSSSKSITFADRIRARDRKCLITGLTTIHRSWTRLHAAHIFARAHLDRWRTLGFDDLVDDTGRQLGDAKIDSVQSGLLLRADLHAAFNAHEFAVDVDNDYAIFDFTAAGGEHGGRLDLDHLEPGSSERPLDALLRDHFWQAVLANVRGAPEVHDEEPDDDWTNPDTLRMDNDALHRTETGRLRLELELGSRLNHLVT